jgi:hypothetical protein
LLKFPTTSRFHSQPPFIIKKIYFAADTKKEAPEISLQLL